MSQCLCWMFTHRLLKEQKQHTGPFQVLKVPKQGLGGVGEASAPGCKWIFPGGGAGAQGQVLSVEGAGRLRRDLSCLMSYSVTRLCLTLCSPMDCSTLGFPVLHRLLELVQTRVHWVGGAMQPSHPLSSPFSTFSLSQHQGLFQWVSSSHQVAKVLELQLKYQSFQWIFRTDFL